MRVAQNLYESGFITYMRTDSLNLSDTALKSAENVITSEFGDKYYKKRVFKTKTKGAQEAHEAIRPTDFKKENIEGTYDERKLYDLIRKRAMASQMSDAVFEKTNVKIDISKSKYFYSASGEVLIFDGFLKVYNNSEEDEEKKVFLPTIKVGQKPELKISEAIQKYTKHSARYTEAALVKKMEELGIGRPSTYAPTISTIQNRGYVLKEDREGTVRKFKIITFSPDKKINVSENKETIGTEKSKLFPTDIGMVVTDFLAENFTEIIDYNFTANVENEFDIISLGKLEWQKMIKDFYEKFHKQVEDTIKFSERNTGERILGIDQETGNEISVRLGRFGPVVQSQKIGSEDKPQFASLNKGQHIETISLDEALGLLKNSFSGRLLGQDPETGKNIYTRIARYGAIAQIGENDDAEKPRFAPLLSGMTIENITLEQAVELFRLPRYIGDYQEKNITIAVGKFGPYVKFGNLFASLKKDDNPLTIKLERAVELIKEKIQKDKDRLIKDFPENDKVIIIKDRWGRPCIFFNKKYFNIADIKNPETLTLEKCMEIIDKTIGKEPKKTGKTKKK
jgi:DNA topoisomerase-1